MQILFVMLLDAADYAAGEVHRQIRPPRYCPHCRKAKALLTLGYYERYVTAGGSGRIVTIKVRRFCCSICGRTVSMLPSFAQPYRLVCTLTIERFFGGHDRLDTQTWRSLLRRYWRRFIAWLPKLMRTVERVLGLSPPESAGKGSWRALIEAYGHLERATRLLVKKFQVTVFGKYRCHSPIRPWQ